MGNGASSKKSQDQKKDQDFGDEDNDQEDFDSYARKKAQENRSGQQRLEQAGLLPKLECTPERSKPVVRETIIGLDDSDDDEGIKPKKITNTKSKPRNKKEDEKELRKEIMELERTFESLDLESTSTYNNTNHTSVKKSTFTRGGLFRSSTIDEGSYQRPNNGPNRRPPPVLGFGTPAVSKPLKFSWQESSAPAIVDKHTDDWNYQQTVIDGFDPDKFRKVNKEKNSPQDSGIRIERQFGSASSSDSGIRMGAGASNARMTTIEMPGVPSYDNTEKQLLASLEQELGVL